MQVSELVDLLLPGDQDFPSASAVGVHGLLTTRLRELAGDAAVERLTAALTELDVAGIEREQPDLFEQVREVVFPTYYEVPAVQDVIRSLGHRYNATPLPKGYQMGRFDPATDTPTHNRGGYVPTNEVRRADLSKLDHVRCNHD